MINFLDLQAINRFYSDELKRVASEVIDSGWYMMGKELTKFEESLAVYNSIYE